MESMTGYGIVRRKVKDATIIVEAKSLNSRFLEVLPKLSMNTQWYEKRVRDLVIKTVKRGKIFVSIACEGKNDALKNLYKKEDVLKAVHNINSIRDVIDSKENIKVQDVLRLMFYFQETNVSDEELKWQQVEMLLKKALAEMVSMRKKEGEQIKKDLAKNLASINGALEKIEKISKRNIQAKKKKAQENLLAILGDQENTFADRIQAEVSLLSKSLDITEECQRLRAHNIFFEKLLKSGKSEGKKLNFLIQEQGREINTIASKSQSYDISKYVILMKEDLEKMREHIQNVE